MRIVMIAAVAENNVIGKDNQLLWKLPNDFKRFKEVTSGHHIIMGRKTFESLPGLLPNRTHIVITRDTEKLQKMIDANPKLASQVIVADGVEKAIALCPINDTSYIIGGGEIYTEAMDFADELDLTKVHASFMGDAFFPAIDPRVWNLTTVDRNKADELHEYDYTFCTFQRFKFNEN